MKTFRTKKLKNGFTLLETLIAVFVILIGVLGVYAAVQYPLFVSSYSRSRLTALYLAQEGIEIVKNIRDENFLNNADWKFGLQPDGEYEADYNDEALFSYNGNFLKINNGFYQYGSSGADTNFKRKITLSSESDSSGSNYLKVSVLVEWYKGGSKAGEVEVEDRLYGYWD